jgi:ABC-type uncharacterized transport system YnjBCD substrate-binding protein
MHSKRCRGCARSLRVLGLALAVFATAPSHTASFDAGKLTRDNFYQTLEPAAKAEGQLVFYNFAGNFDPVWKLGLIPKFEARYGIKVAYSNVRKDQANQQLIAVHKAGRPSPVDVYFAGSSDNFDALNEAGVVARLKLSSLLPNLAAVPSEYKDVIFGVNTGGNWPLVHRSQLVLGYDSATLPTSQMPASFEALLAWAQKNPGKFAITSPAKGGSGAGFLYSAALHFVTDAACKQTLRDVRLRHEQVVRWAGDAACLQPLWAYLTQLVKVSELTNGNADTLNLLNNKQVLIGTSWEDLMLTFVIGKQLPETSRSALLAPGLIAGGDGIFIPANTRNMAAALLFIDMAMGREFQTWKLQQHASRPVRNDIDPAAVAGAAAARYLVPPEQMKTWSVPANWAVTRGLAQVFEDKVLSKR